MKRSYTRYNTLNEDARRQQLRSNLRNSNRIVEDEEELDDIEIEADAVDSEVEGTDEDFKQKLIDLFNQAIEAGILTIEDLTGEAGDDEGEDEEASEDDFGEDDLEESTKRTAARNRKVDEAKSRIMARRRVANPRVVESTRRRVAARPTSARR